MKIKLKEDTFKQELDTAANDASVVSSDGQVERALDRALAKSRLAQRAGGNQFQNVLLIGPAGTGKTSRVQAWADHNGINLVKVLASTMDDTDLGGAIAPDSEQGIVRRYSSTELDQLEEPNSVLFLDEFNRAPHSVRGTLLTLIQDHEIPDAREKGKVRYLKNFLFTVAAINPASNEYNTDELDDAEKSRFRHVNMEGDPLSTMNWFVGYTNKLMKSAESEEELRQIAGQQALGKAILGSRQFNFDDDTDVQNSKERGNGLILQARSLTNALLASDGTKDDFIEIFPDFCNSTKLPMIERILMNYEDVDDKAIQALSGTNSGVFRGRETQAATKPSQRAAAALGDLED